MKGEKDQADLGDRLNAVLILHQIEAEPTGTDDDAGHQVREDQRLAKTPTDKRQQRGGSDADPDARQQVGPDYHEGVETFSSLLTALGTSR